MSDPTIRETPAEREQQADVVEQGAIAHYRRVGGDRAEGAMDMAGSLAAHAEVLLAEFTPAPVTPNSKTLSTLDAQGRYLHIPASEAETPPTPPQTVEQANQRDILLAQITAADLLCKNGDIVEARAELMKADGQVDALIAAVRQEQSALADQWRTIANDRAARIARDFIVRAELKARAERAEAALQAHQEPT